MFVYALCIFLVCFDDIFKVGFELMNWKSWLLWCIHIMCTTSGSWCGHWGFLGFLVVEGILYVSVSSWKCVLICVFGYEFECWFLLVYHLWFGVISIVMFIFLI